MKKIVLTGGPCSGKSTVQQALRGEFADRIVLVPEVATLLLSGGFPVPGRHLPWSEQWQETFQSAVVPVQEALEDAHLLLARSRGCDLVVCDRGLLDAAAYTPGGVHEFCRRYRVDHQGALLRYDVVIHLESLATADPAQYGTQNNEHRFESLEQAQRVEWATRAVWAGHAHHVLITGRTGFENKLTEVLALVRGLLGEPA